MAKVASVNVDCATNGGADVIWNLVSLLLANGWTKFADSDGTTYSGTGTQVTGPGSGANGLNNANAWVALQDPSGSSGRKYLFQRGSANSSWWIRYVRSATLNTAGNATTMPTNPSVANDLNDLWGTTAAGATLFSTTGTNYFAHAVTETTPSFGVYQFWFAATVKVTGALQGGGYVAGVDTTAVSGGLDQDPSVMKIASNNSWAGEFNNIQRWMYYGLVSPAPAFASTGCFVSTPQAIASVNGYTGADDALPLLATADNSTYAPYKGQVTWMRLGLVTRSYPSTINLNTDAYCYFSATYRLLLPWPNGVTPSL